MTVTNEPKRTVLRFRTRRPIALNVVFTKKDGRTRVDVTGATLTFKMGTLSQAATLVDGPGGMFRLDLQADDLNLTPDRDIPFDLSFRSAAGFTSSVLAGEVSVLPNADSTVPADYDPDDVAPTDSLTVRMLDAHTFRVQLDHTPDLVLQSYVDLAAISRSEAALAADRAEAAADVASDAADTVNAGMGNITGAISSGLANISTATTTGVTAVQDATDDGLAALAANVGSGSASATAAAASAAAAATSATNAGTQATTAAGHATAASASATAAATSATAANTSKNDAASARADAQAARTDALTARTQAQASATDSGAAKLAAESARDQATGRRDEAAASAAEANTSKLAAEAAAAEAAGYASAIELPTFEFYEDASGVYQMGYGPKILSFNALDSLTLDFNRSRNDHTDVWLIQIANTAGAEVVVSTMSSIGQIYQPPEFSLDVNDVLILEARNHGQFITVSKLGPEKDVDAVTSTTVDKIVTLTQAAYDALSPDPDTLYFIVG